MTADSILGALVVAFASYRVTRLIVLDVLIDEPRMWVLRSLAPRPNPSAGISGRLPSARRGSRLPRARMKLAEGLQCSFCVGVWVTIGLAGAWHLNGYARAPIVVAAICGLQALLSSWEGE